MESPRRDQACRCCTTSTRRQVIDVLSQAAQPPENEDIGRKYATILRDPKSKIQNPKSSQPQLCNKVNPFLKRKQPKP